ncbi:MAG: helix-turn-helix domain-containing protein [Candidatus Woesearchaeota archaeon]
MDIKTKSWYFFRCQELVFEDDNLKPRDKLVYAVISKYADTDTGHAYPSVKTITKKSGYSSKNTVLKAIRKLTDVGYISKKSRTDQNGKDTSNLYTVKDLSYIFNLKKYAKNIKNEKLLKIINDRLKRHPIPTYEEIMHLQSQLIKEDNSKQSQKEMKDLYEKGYR